MEADHDEPDHVLLGGDVAGSWVSPTDVNEKLMRRGELRSDRDQVKDGRHDAH